MKKLIRLFAVAIVMILASCSGNSPLAVAEKYMNYMNDGEYNKVVELIYTKPETPEDKVKEEMEDFVEFLKEMRKDIKEEEKIKSLKIISEEINEDGTKAVVKYSSVLNNGKEENSEIKLIKDEKGKWKIDLGK